MSRPRLDRARVAELYQASGAGRWGVSADAFESRLNACVAHALDGGAVSPADVSRVLNGLHVEDLALAMACEAGHSAAWEYFGSQYRPVLQRAAGAIDPTGRAADLADVLFADLYGADVRDGERRSLFRYFHGRSRLGTWLRAVLAQRHIDRLRQDRRTESIDDHDSLPARGNGDAHPDHARFTAAMDAALRSAIDTLPARDRLLLGCYYVQDMTLAAIGRLLKEHEATVSRHLTRVRRELRERVESELRRAHAMDDAAVAECFRAVSADAGPLDLRELLGPAAAPAAAPAGRKDPRPGRSST